MRYSDFIEVNEEFQTSINLEYDLNRIEKVKSYIPAEQSVKILGTFLKSFYYRQDSHNRARVLIGPYGRGKSYLLLVLAALTSLDVFCPPQNKEEAQNVQMMLCNKIESVDAEIGALAKLIVENNIRTLPVIINSNSTDINQAFLVALKDALEKAGVDSILPSTYFDAAVDVLDRWKDNYPEAIKKFSKALRSYKISLEQIYIELKQFNQEAYTIFCSCYPDVTAGIEFNPFSNMDVVKLYISVVNALAEQTGYTGINIIFDEFSKFLEANIDTSKMLNFKIIQDMAEVATRSGDRQIHFTCITHRDILDYSTSDSFKTVEGRFSKIYYIASSEQSYELIANAIPKKEAFADFVKEFPAEYKSALGTASIVNVFSELTAEAFEKKVVCGCFPLAPLSAFALLHTSELVGQNERTLFTFLAKPEEFSLCEFLLEDHSGMEFIKVDRIYDYFQELLKKEIFNSAVHSLWAKADTALRQIDNELQAQIIKAIAVINIINDERFKATPSHIKAALLMSDGDFDEAVRGLLQKHVLFQKDSSEFVMLTANGVDVQKNVEAYVNTKISKINECELLEEKFPLGYVFPREYNDKYSMLRYFKKVYMSTAAFLSYKSGAALLKDYPYDGVILYLLASTREEVVSAVVHLDTFRDSPQIVLCVTDYGYDFNAELKRTVAVQYLKKSDLTQDPHYMEEIQIYEEDLRKQIASKIDMMYSPSSKYSHYRNCAGSLGVYRQADLSLEISKICLTCFCKTPIVNNEMVNKSTLNAQNIKGRNAVLAWILEHADDERIPCPEGYGPEVSIFKSMYQYTGLDKTEQVQDQGINSVLGLITEFVSECEVKANSFDSVYFVLEHAPYGMRRGIIPLFIVYVLRKYKENIIVYYKGKEVELSGHILSSINEAPDDYSLLLEKGTQEREEFLNKLGDMFAAYSDGHTTSVNRVYSIVRSMQTWMRSLPEYSKRFSVTYSDGVTKTVDNSTKVIRKDLLKFEINAREMLFCNWRNQLSLSGSLDECSCEISRVKELLDTHIQTFRYELLNYMVALFIPGYSGSLSKAMKLWYDKLPDSTKRHIFDSMANDLLALAGTWNSYDDTYLLNELAMTFTSMALEDWTDDLAQQFCKQIEGTIDRINNYVESVSERVGCKLAITLPGGVVEKSFVDSEISPLGKTALSNLRSVFEEYNDAIEPDEQLAIIAELIRDIVN